MALHQPVELAAEIVQVENPEESWIGTWPISRHIRTWPSRPRFRSHRLIWRYPQTNRVFAPAFKMGRQVQISILPREVGGL